MQRVILDRDVKPISEFRANAAGLVKQARRTKRPLVITQQGRSTAILVNVSGHLIPRPARKYWRESAIKFVRSDLALEWVAEISD